MEIVDNNSIIVDGQTIPLSTQGAIILRSNQDPILGEYPINLVAPSKLQIAETYEDILMSVIRRPPSFPRKPT